MRWLVVLCMILAPILAPVTAGAQNDPFGLDATATTVVLINPETRSATVTVSYRFTNSTSDISFGAFFEQLPTGANIVSATMGGADAQTVIFGSDDRFSSVVVTFQPPIKPGETLEGQLVYIVGSAGDVDALAYISPGLIAVAPFAAAHGSGSGSVEVHIPARFGVVQAHRWDVNTEDDNSVFTAVDPVAFQPIPLVVEDPAALLRQDVVSEDFDLTLATLDRATARDAIGLVEQASALVVQRTGLSSDRPIEIRHGWSGEAPVRYPVADRGIAVVSPEADLGIYTEVIAREVLASIDWVEEALLDDTVAAVAAAAASSGESPERGGWTGAIVDALAPIDPESAHGVFAALAGDEITYSGSARTVRVDPVDWRMVLDAFENVTGAQIAASFVAEGASETEIERRRSARVAYFELADTADGWSLPPYLRTPMADWRFAEFAARRQAVSELVIARDELRAIADREGLAIGPHLRTEFESADATMAVAWGVFEDQREAIDFVAEAQSLVTADHGLLAGIGLFNYDSDALLRRILDLWEQGEFAKSQHEAESLIETYEGAVRRGTLLVAIPSVLLVALAAAARWLFGWRRSSPSNQDPENQDSDPENQDSDPENQDSDPENQDSDPENQDSDPENQDPDPENQDPENQEVV